MFYEFIKGENEYNKPFLIIDKPKDLLNYNKKENCVKTTESKEQSKEPTQNIKNEGVGTKKKIVIIEKTEGGNILNKKTEYYITQLPIPIANF